MNSTPLDSSLVNHLVANSEQENPVKDTLIENQGKEKKQEEEEEQNDFSKGSQQDSLPETTDPTKRKLSRPTQFEIEMANKEMFHFFSLRKMNKGTIKLPERVSTFWATNTQDDQTTRTLPGDLYISILTSLLHLFTNH